MQTDREKNKGRQTNNEKKIETDRQKMRQIRLTGKTLKGELMSRNPRLKDACTMVQNRFWDVKFYT